MKSFPAAMVACGAVGAVMVAGSILRGHTGLGGAAPEYGRLLMQRPIAGSHFACASCHIDEGAEPGELSLVHAVQHQPNIPERINRCITGNMNGRPLASGSAEMAAMVAWLHFLAGRDTATGASEREAHDPLPFQPPSRAPNLAEGEMLFQKRCADCHGKDGAGLPATRNIADGYLFPPLWGPYSFNSAADMANASIAAKFIKAKMPLGRADLDDEQALDVAAFIESKERPIRATLARNSF